MRWNWHQFKWGSLNDHLLSYLPRGFIFYNIGYKGTTRHQHNSISISNHILYLHKGTIFYKIGYQGDIRHSHNNSRKNPVHSDHIFVTNVWLMAKATQFAIAFVPVLCGTLVGIVHSHMYN